MQKYYQKKTWCACIWGRLGLKEFQIKKSVAIIKSEIYYYFLHKYRGNYITLTSQVPAVVRVFSTWPSVSDLPEFV